LAVFTHIYRIGCAIWSSHSLQAFQVPFFRRVKAFPGYSRTTVRRNHLEAFDLLEPRAPRKSNRPNKTNQCCHPENPR